MKFPRRFIYTATFILLVSIFSVCNASPLEADKLVNGYIYLRVNRQTKACYPAMSHNFKKIISKNEYETLHDLNLQIYRTNSMMPMYLGKHENIEINHKLYASANKYSILINTYDLLLNKPIHSSFEIFVVLDDDNELKLEQELKSPPRKSIAELFTYLGDSHLSGFDKNILEALSLYRRALTYYELAWTHESMANAYIKQGLYKESEKHLDKAWSIADTNEEKSRVKTYFAVLAEMQGNRTSVIRYYKEALALDDTNEAARNALLLLENQ